MIKVVAFDIGNTIYKVDKKNSILQKLSEMLCLPKERVKISYNKIFNVNNYSLEELCNMLCKDLNSTKVSEVLNFFKSLQIGSNAYEYVDKNLLNLIKAIKQSGVKVVLSSNSNILHKNLIDAKLASLVDDIFRTYEIGYQKYEENYYRYIEKKLNVKPEEILNIGDNELIDYQIPKSYGWQAVLFNCESGKIFNVQELKEELKKYISFNWQT